MRCDGCMLDNFPYAAIDIEECLKCKRAYKENTQEHKQLNDLYEYCNLGWRE